MFVTNSKYSINQDDIQLIIKKFEVSEAFFHQRNTLKIVEWEGISLAIKSYKKPNFIQAFYYRLIGKPKAQKAFENALQLRIQNIETPEPFFYYVEKKGLKIGHSYLATRYWPYDWTARELLKKPRIDHWQETAELLCQVALELRLNGFFFKDFSPGNVLFRKSKNGELKYSLVDINRMDFNNYSETKLIDNLAKLSPDKKMIDAFSKILAKETKLTESQIRAQLKKNAKKLALRKEQKNRLKQLIGIKVRENPYPY